MKHLPIRTDAAALTTLPDADRDSGGLTGKLKRCGEGGAAVAEQRRLADEKSRQAGDGGAAAPASLPSIKTPKTS